MPAGPFQHGRGAAVGDSLARLLRMAGYDVNTEYYINDAGRQMRLLGLSVWLRAKELAGKPVTWPEDYYKGDYIIDIAREMLDANPALVQLPDAEGQDVCYDKAMTYGPAFPHPRPSRFGSGRLHHAMRSLQLRPAASSTRLT